MTALSATVEIEFTAGVWTDVSADLVFDQGSPIAIHHGRSAEFDTLQPSTCTLTLANGTGKYTPDNPAGDYWPNVIENKRIRVRVYSPAVWRFRGYIDAWDVDFPEGTPASAVATISASCPLSRLARRILRTDTAETAILGAASAGGTLDYWMASQGDQGGTLPNLDQAGYDAQIISPVGGIGSWSVATAEEIQADGLLSLTPDSTGPGPVLLARPRATSLPEVWFWLRTTTVPGAGSTFTVFEAYDSARSLICDVRVTNVAGKAALTLYDGGGSALGSTDTWLNDGKWRAVNVSSIGTTASLVSWRGVATSSTSISGPASGDMATAAYLVLGGSMPPGKPGKQSAGFTGDIGGMHVTKDSGHDQIAVAWVIPNPASARFTGLMSYQATVTAGTDGPNTKELAWRSYAGLSLLDALNDVAVTTRNLTWHHPVADLTRVYDPYPALSPTPVMTITLDADDDSEPGMPWRRAIDSRPTRCTVTGTLGSGSYVDTAAETASGLVVAEDVSTSSGSALDARDVAGWRVSRSVAMRPATLAVDMLAGIAKDWAGLLSLRPGDPVSVTGLPSAIFGVTQAYFHAVGWRETYAIDRAVVELDLVPFVSMARFDTSRFGAGGTMTVTSGTAVGGTGTGTIVVTTAGSNPTFSTAAGDWPQDLDWNGERVTVTAAPAGATSPQPLTITARGVAPTIARAHQAGEPIDVWQPPKFSYS